MILVIVILIIGAGGIYIFRNDSQNVDLSNTPINSSYISNSADNRNNNVAVNTRDWQIYQNTKYKYSFMYPHSLLLADSPNSSIPDNETTWITFGNDSMTFGVKVTEADSCDTVSSCVQKYPYSIGNEIIKGNLESETIAGLQGLSEIDKTQQVGNTGWIYHTWYVLKERQFYTLYSISSIADDSQNSSISRAIVSSFQFSK